MKTKRLFPILSIFLIAAQADATVMGINFGLGEQTGPTASYTSTVLGVTVVDWNYETASDWSNNPKTFSADGASIRIWHDAGGIWRNDDEAETSPLHGYLDDGDVNQNYIHLGGLSDWLAATGHNEWRVTVLRSTDNATGFSSIAATTGDVLGESNWFGNSTPSGGSTATSTIPSVDFGTGGKHVYETEVFTGSANGLALHYEQRDGKTRGSVAGIVIQAVPDGGTTVALLGAALLGLGGVGRKLRVR